MSTTIDKAIILAAGMGKRISKTPSSQHDGADAVVPSNTPKPFLPIHESGLTFVDWHLRSLRAAGAKEIFLVGSNATFGTKTKAMDDIPVTWVMNDFPGDTTGSGHSTHLAFTSPHGILDGKSRVVLMDADVVYDPTLFRELAAAPGRKSKTLVCGRFRETDEEVMVFADPNRVPRVHGKGLLKTPTVKGLTCLGEATGILLLEPDDHQHWLDAAAWCMKFSTAKTRTEHEDITQRLMLAGALDAVSFDDDTRCMECDTPDEYAVVRSEMVPRWLPGLPEAR